MTLFPSSDTCTTIVTPHLIWHIFKLWDKPSLILQWWPLVFSSPEPRVKWAFQITNFPLSADVVVVVVGVGVVSSPEPLDQFQANLARCILGWRGLKLVQMKDPPFSKGRWLLNSKNTLTNLKKSSSPEPLSQFNQAWQKASLGAGDSSLFKGRTIQFS